jgi:hypothetical protein
MLTFSEFDGNAPFVEPLQFKPMDVPGLEGVKVLRDSIMSTMVLQKNRITHIDERWNAGLGAYAEKLRDYVSEVDKVVEADVAMEDLFQKLRNDELELDEALGTIKGNPNMKARYKSASSEWKRESKEVYKVRYRSAAWVCARVTAQENFDHYMEAVGEFMGSARYYLQEVDAAYAFLMRSALHGLPKPPKSSARSGGDGVQATTLKERLSAALSQLSSSSGESDAEASNDTMDTGSGDKAGHGNHEGHKEPMVHDHEGHSAPGVAATPSHYEAGTTRSPSGSAGKRHRASASLRHDKPSRTEHFLKRNDNLHIYSDTTLPYDERLRACNALLQALPATVAKIVPSAVHSCPDMEPDNLRHYIEAVQHALDANSDLEPVWYHLYFNKLPSDIQTAIHQHFAPLPMSLVSFQEVATHIRETYISTEMLVTVLHKLRTQIAFNPRLKGSAQTFSLSVRMARDRLRAQFGDQINDTAMLGYVNDWIGQGNWMSREFNKFMLGKTNTWENINMALVYCVQHDALYTTSTRDTTQPSTSDLKARTQTDRPNRYHPYTQPGKTSRELPHTIRQMQATLNNLATQVYQSNQAPPNFVQPQYSTHSPPVISHLNTHAMPPPPTYNRPWSEKFCSFCKFAGKPASLYNSHNTFECRLKDEPENAEMKTAWASRLTKNHPDNPVNPHNKTQTNRPGLGSDK